MTKRTKITVPSTVKWLSEVVVDPNCLSSSFKHYERFQFGEIEAKIGDFVLISNADAAEPDTEHGCDAAQIVSLYEDSTNQKDPFRSRVQWYTRPTDLPAWCFNNTEPIQFMHDEVIEDHRPFNTDVSIETFFKPCVITFKLTKDFSTLYRPYFDYVCRYRLMSLSKRKVIMEPVMEEERKAIQLLSSIPITPKTPTSLVKRMSRVSLSERKNWSISKAEGTKLLLKRAIFADKTEKVSPKKITPNTKTPKTSASETPKSLKKGNTNNLEDILSMELRENSDDELPTLIIRQNSGTTPKRQPSVSKQNEETPNKRQSVSKRNEQTSKIKLVFDTEKSSSTKLNNKINNLEEDVSPVQQTPRRTRNVSEAEIKIDCVQKIPVLCLEKIRETTSKTNKETPKRRQSIAKTNAETPNKKQSVSKRNVETLEINQSKKSLYTTRSSRATTSKINYAEEEPSPVKRTPRRTRKVSEAEGEKEYEPTQKMSVLRLDDESPHAFKQTPRRTRKVTETDDEFQPLPKTPKLPKTPRTPKTPAQTPQQRVCRKLISQMTPTLRTRAETVEGDGLYVKPTTKMSLPGRESQLAEILSFVKTKLLDETSGCMYISGMPGTGKTETVKLVLQMLKEDEDLPEFNLLEVNGMRIAEPRQAYVQIYKQLTGKAVVWEQACSLLEKRFTTSEPRRTPTVLLVDELDVLCTRRQDVLYSIMEWATHDTALLTVLAVANTMDLPERALAARVASRLGLTRLTFPPYTHAQLQKIVATRLAFKNVTPDAVQLISRKVAAVSGDARRALALCRRALELAGAEGAGLAQVQRALGEASSGAALQAVRRASGAERLLLRAVAAEVERTGLEETTLSRALSTAAAIVALDGRPYKAARSIRAPTPSQALAICSRLASLKLLLIEPKPAEPRLLLNISVDDVHYATRDLQV